MACVWSKLLIPRRTTVAFGAQFLLFACSTPDPARVAQIDEVFSRSRTATYPNASRIPLEVGQWVLLRVRDEDGRRALKRYAVTRREGNGFWVERHDVHPESETHLALFVVDVDPEHMERARIVKMRLDEGAEELVVSADEVSGDARPDSAREKLDQIREQLRSLIVGWQLRTRRDAVDVMVPAGTFQGARESSVTVSDRHGEWSGYVWFTRAVPILGYAKMNLSGKEFFFLEESVREEVVDFGTSGAVSHFFEE